MQAARDPLGDGTGSGRWYADRDREVTQQLRGILASASEEFSADVQWVASATEEMTSSVNEISRQVQELAKSAAMP
jgi:methyl-accepting chemotaxis protein